MQKLYFADPQGALSIAVAVVLAGRRTFTMSAKKKVQSLAGRNFFENVRSRLIQSVVVMASLCNMI